MIPESTLLATRKPESVAAGIYVGSRTNRGPCVVVRTLEQVTPLLPRLDLIRHAPVGFDWADGSSSGAAQLALALLAHASGDDSMALEHHQLFMHEIILRLPRAGWSLTASQILQMLRFVSVDFEASDSVDPRENCRKRAIVHAVLPGKHCQRVIIAEGGGRSIRGAATRALLNLLGDKRLRRRRIAQLQIELSIFSAQENTPNQPTAEGHLLGGHGEFEL